MTLVTNFPFVATLYERSSTLYNQACSHIDRISKVALDCLHEAGVWVYRNVETARDYFSQINVSRLSAMSDKARDYLLPSFHSVRTSLGEGTARIYSCISHLPAQGRESLSRLSAIGARAGASLSRPVIKSSDFLRSHKVAAILCATGLGVAIWGWARPKKTPLPPANGTSLTPTPKAVSPDVSRPVPLDSRGPQCTLERVSALFGLTLKAPQTENRDPPAELLLCVDVSGSMNGPRINAAKQAVLAILKEVGLQIKKKPDRPISLGIVEFNNCAKWTVEKGPLNERLISELTDRVNGDLFLCRDGTQILLGLQKALEGLPASDRGDRPRHGLVLLTDGDQRNLKAQDVEPLHTRLAEAGTDFLVIQIKDDKGIGSLEGPLCTDKREPTTNIPPLRVEYVGLDGSQSGDLSPVVKKITELFGRQLNPMFTVNAVTTSPPWTVEPLRAPIYIAPGQEGFFRITATSTSFPAPSPVPLSIECRDYKGRPVTFQRVMPLTALGLDAS